MIQQNKIKIISQNKSISFDYIIIHKLECGIVLKGTEVKALRLQGGNIKGGFASVNKNIFTLYNINIPKYKYSFNNNHDTNAPRLLLAKKKQLRKIRDEISKGFVHILPEKLYFNEKNLVKVMICICKIAKKIDKREKIKAKETRHIIAEIKNYINF